MSISTFDFQDGLGPVPAHRHINPDGSEGGWIAETAQVASTCYVGENAQVSGSALVYENAHISSNLQILWGFSGGYNWTAYQTVSETIPENTKDIWFQYGCEAHPLTWWEAQTPELSVKHGHNEEHAKYWMSIVQMVKNTL